MTSSVGDGGRKLEGRSWVHVDGPKTSRASAAWRARSSAKGLTQGRKARDSSSWRWVKAGAL